MLLRRVIEHVKAQNWTAVALDFVIVVVGVFIGIQVANWNEARSQRAAEQRYLVRLFIDTQANLAELQNLVNMHKRRAAVFAELENAIETGGDAPPQDSLQETLCRFFVQPSASLHQGTYDELIASGALSILRDEKLRGLLSRQQAAVADAARLDIMTPAIQRATMPLDDYREWKIIRDVEGEPIYGGVGCSFDIDGMRADSQIPSMVAQLYRDQNVTQRSRQAILDIAIEVDVRLRELIPDRQIPSSEG